MIPFQIHRRIPVIRRPFYQRDEALRARDAAIAALDQMATERGQAIADRAAMAIERDNALRRKGLFDWVLNRRPVMDAIYPQRSTSIPVPDDVHLVDRLIAAYREADERYTKSASGFWDHELWEIKRPVHDALLIGNRDEVASILRNPAATSLFWGFDALAKGPPGAIEPHEFVLRRVGDGDDWMKMYAVWVMDGLRSLAEAVGAVRITYPEAGAESETMVGGLPSADLILDAIEARIGFALEFPNPFPHEVGLPTRRGIVSFRSVQAIYQAWRIYQLIGGDPGKRVVEIGGGLGRTAYYAWRFGLRNYTMVDLPLTSVAQGYFLGCTLGGEAIRLSGETGPGIRIIPPADFLSGQGRYDLAVNVDSLTEMGAETAAAYCATVKARAEIFLSINHDFNPRTAQALCEQAGMKARSRSPYWLRRGYVEEIFVN